MGVATESDELADFYSALKRGCSVAALLDKFEGVVGFVHKEGMTQDFRLARGKVKKLRDEVSPVVRFVRCQAAPQDRIWFAMGDSAPDCWLKNESGQVREIEVTVAQAKERFHAMTELNETGTGRAFLGLSDDMPMAQFEEKMTEPRTAYSEAEILDSVAKAVAICLRKKSKFRADTLLIDAPLETLPLNRWYKLSSRLQDEVDETPFSEVYVVGQSGDCDLCIRLR